MADVRCYSRQFLTEFIELYRSLPCLWKMKSKEYSNRTLKSICYQKMIDKLKVVEPNATRDLVIKKINSLRTSRRKELKKIKESSQSGCVYKPSLWYFDLLNFTDDQETPLQPTSNFDDQLSLEPSCPDNVKKEMVENNFSSEDNASETNSRTSRISIEYQDVEYEYPGTSYISTSIQNHPRPPKRKIAHNSFDRPVNESHFEDDRFDIFGKNVAMKMRDLSTQQRLIAEKIINDTLFKAEMGTLKLSDAMDCKSTTD